MEHRVSPPADLDELRLLLRKALAARKQEHLDARDLVDEGADKDARDDGARPSATASGPGRKNLCKERCLRSFRCG